MSVTDRVNERAEARGPVEMRYVVLESATSLELLADVEEYIQDGWVCQGGVAIAILPAGREWPPIYKVHYAQAMVFDEDTSWLASEDQEDEE